MTVKNSENLLSDGTPPLLCYYFELMNLFWGSEPALGREIRFALNERRKLVENEKILHLTEQNTWTNPDEAHQ